jgi:hypothetical protein
MIRNVGFILLSIWLILIALLSLNFNGLGIVMGVLVILAGIFILLGK